MTAPQINPGDIANWPLLKVVYRTDPDKIADLLPPGIEPGADPHVHVNIYNVPVKGEPEYGVSTKVVANYEGTPGYYGIGLGIDQESAIFISQELNGQPKFPCSIVYFRRDDVGRSALHAPGLHVPRVPRPGDRRRRRRPCRLRRARLVDQVVACGRRCREELRLPAARRRRGVGVSRPSAGRSSTGRSCCATARGTRTRPLLPMREQVSANLVWSASKSRGITLAGPLDPIAFWPYADTIGGSRWPGLMGGPRFER